MSFSGNMKTNNVFSLSLCVDVKCLLLAGAAVSFLTQNIFGQAITDHVPVMNLGLFHGGTVADWEFKEDLAAEKTCCLKIWNFWFCLFGPYFCDAQRCFLGRGGLISSIKERVLRVCCGKSDAPLAMLVIVWWWFLKEKWTERWQNGRILSQTFWNTNLH